MTIEDLVKELAREVFFQEIVHVKDRMRRIEESSDASLKFIESIQSSLKEAGNYWSDEEDNLLVQEVRTAISQIAKNHHRSNGAIASRVAQKELIQKEI